ncbi:MAG: hypothetical protein JNK21_13385 [Rhodospirillaceae bacterium]|nr:hypothetical protein [Rhodospirillaceae bacterium]
MVIVAIIMASAEAVMALGASGHAGLATSDIVTLLTGQAPQFSTTRWPEIFSALGSGVMAMPAWLVTGVIGLSLAHIFRARRIRRRVSTIRPL